MKRKKLRVALMSALIALGGTSLVLGTLVSCGTTQTYQVTYEASDDYTISIASGTEYAEGDTVSFTVTVADGKTLTDVTANGTSLGNSGSYTITMPNSEVVLVVTVSDTSAQYTFKATATGTWGTGETLTISATLNDTATSDFTIEATTGADLVTINNNAKTVALNAAGDLVLTITTTTNGVTLTDTISGTITELDYSISQINAEGSYIIRGTVVAKNTRAYLVYDGTAGIYCYDYSGVDSVSVGNYVQVSGTVELYHQIYQFNSPTTTVLSTTGETYDDSPTELTTTLVDYVASEANDNAVTNVGYYTWTATVGNSGGYTTLNLDGSDVNIEPMYVDSDEITLVEGQTYTVTAWYYGYDRSHDYVAVVLSSAELVTGGITVTAANNATSVGVGETLQLSAEYENGGTVTDVTWTSSDSDVATVSSSGLVTGVKGGSVVITATDSDDKYGSIILTVSKTSATFHTGTDNSGVELSEVAADTDYDGYEVYLVKGVQVSYISTSYAYYGQIGITDGTTTIELYNSVYNTDYTKVLVLQSDGSYEYEYGGENSQRITALENFVVGVSIDAYIIAQTTSTGYTNYYGCILSYSQVTPTSVTIDQGTELSLDIGQTRTLSVTTNPTLVSVTPTWSSNAESVATVTQDGVVEAIASGTATITVTYTESVYATIAVTVSNSQYEQASPIGTYSYTLANTLSGNVYQSSVSDSNIMEKINDVNDSTATNNLITAATVDQINGKNTAVYTQSNATAAGFKLGAGSSSSSSSARNGGYTVTTSQAVSSVKLTMVAWSNDTPIVNVNDVVYTYTSSGDGSTAVEYTFEFNESTNTVSISGDLTKEGGNRFAVIGMVFYA